jgi:hypothetical protein
VFDLELRLAVSQTPHSRRERACAGYQGEHEGWVFGRVGASGLSAQGKRHGEHQDEAEKEKHLFQVHRFLEFAFVSPERSAV